MLRVFSVKEKKFDKQTFANGFRLGDSYRHFRVVMSDAKRSTAKMITDHEYHEKSYNKNDDYRCSAPLDRSEAQRIVKWNRDPKNSNIDEHDNDYVFREGLWD